MLNMVSKSVSYMICTDFVYFRIPNVHVGSTEKGTAELELSDDPYDCRRLDVTHLPCIITLSKV